MAGLLYPGELRDPSEWVNQTAQCILESVKRAEGWRKVFETGILRWVHKLRNYFNVEPVTLRLLDKGEAGYWMAQIQKHGQLDGTIAKQALSRDVYADQTNVIWYQMGAGGSIFHWGDDVEFMRIEAVHTHLARGQTGIPIFKLVSPDGTTGSRETIVSNPMDNPVEEVDADGRTRTRWKGRSTIGQPGETVHVRQEELHIMTMEHQGSYNFAETSVIGRDWHTRFDVETHQRDKVYIDPRDRFAPLADRIFTATLLQSAGADTRRKLRNMQDTSLDLEEPPMRRSPMGVSNPH